jgi:phosphatidylglycerophosphatase A
MKHLAPRTVWTNWVHFLAFGFGSGAIPFAPGTMGTIAAIPIYLLFAWLPLGWYLFITLVMFVIGIWLCEIAAKDTGVHDHPGIVWDEIVGYMITMIAVPHTLKYILLGFVLFRFFDILKPWPIKPIDKHLKGGLGIMLDDVLAGVFALIIMKLIAWSMGVPF